MCWIDGVIRGVQQLSGRGRFAAFALTVRGDAGPLGTYRLEDFAVAEMIRAVNASEVLMVDMSSAEVSTFEDVDFAGHFCHPPAAAFDRFVALYQAAARQRGADADVGRSLPAWIAAAGFSEPWMPAAPAGSTIRPRRLAAIVSTRMMSTSKTATTARVYSIYAANCRARAKLGSLAKLALQIVER
jgi:hypothetical protein